MRAISTPNSAVEPNLHARPDRGRRYLRPVARASRSAQARTPDSPVLRGKRGSPRAMSSRRSLAAWLRRAANRGPLLSDRWQPVSAGLAVEVVHLGDQVGG